MLQKNRQCPIELKVPFWQSSVPGTWQKNVNSFLSANLETGIVWFRAGLTFMVLSCIILKEKT